MSFAVNLLSRRRIPLFSPSDTFISLPMRFSKSYLHSSASLPFFAHARRMALFLRVNLYPSSNLSDGLAPAAIGWLFQTPGRFTSISPDPNRTPIASPARTAPTFKNSPHPPSSTCGGPHPELPVHRGLLSRTLWDR